MTSTGIRPGARRRALAALALTATVGVIGYAPDVGVFGRHFDFDFDDAGGYDHDDGGHSAGELEER